MNTAANSHIETASKAHHHHHHVEMDDDYKLYPDNTKLSHIPGHYGLPILGHMIDFVQDLRGMVERHMAKYGRFSLDRRN